VRNFVPSLHQLYAMLVMNGLLYRFANNCHFHQESAGRAIGFAVPLIFVLATLHGGWEFPQLVRVDGNGGTKPKGGVRPGQNKTWVN